MKYSEEKKQLNQVFSSDDKVSLFTVHFRFEGRLEIKEEPTQNLNYVSILQLNTTKWKDIKNVKRALLRAFAAFP